MRQQHSYSTEAIVLKRSDLGEADRILTLFTPGKGKFHAVAKGTRRPVSKLAGHLDLLCRSQLQMALGRNLDIVTQAARDAGFPPHYVRRLRRWGAGPRNRIRQPRRGRGVRRHGE